MAFPAVKRHRKIALLTTAVLAAGAAALIATTSGPVRPDARYTPGAILTTNTATVCMSGYTATVRVSLTPAEQATVNREYGWHYAPGKQEYDHAIPLELGGANGLRNIWPQPIAQAHVKDGLENRLHALVCSGRLPITTAQHCIAADWVACARQY